jgi:putative phosphoribosyl transferase
MTALFRDRADAGRELARLLEHAGLRDAVVVGLARGGVAVAAEVARGLSLPLDALAVRKIGYPRQPEYGIGAVAPGEGGIYLRTTEDLGEDVLRRVVTGASEEAEALDRTLHATHPALSVSGKTVVLVDDGLATGATMVAASRWARSHGAERVVVAVPVGAMQTAAILRTEADAVVCLHEQQHFGAVGFWYDAFDQLTDDDVIALLDAGRGDAPA